MKQEVIQGDCLEVMKVMPDKSFDLVLTDPPYGTTACKWDSVIPFEPMWEQLKRIIKPNGAIVLFGSQPFTGALVMSNPKMFKYEWVWDKKKPSIGLHAKIQPLRQHENILVFGNPKYNPIMEKANIRVDKPRRANNGEAFGGKDVLRQHINHGLKYPRSILVISNANQSNRLHPTQKPVALMEYLIKTYTNEGETVLDFTMGSGTTLVAAKQLNRNATGIEISEKYCEIARKRLAETQAPLI